MQAMTRLPGTPPRAPARQGWAMTPIRRLLRPRSRRAGGSRDFVRNGEQGSICRPSLPGPAFTASVRPRPPFHLPCRDLHQQQGGSRARPPDCPGGGTRSGCGCPRRGHQDRRWAARRRRACCRRWRRRCRKAGPLAVAVEPLVREERGDGLAVADAAGADHLDRLVENGKGASSISSPSSSEVSCASRS